MCYIEAMIIISKQLTALRLSRKLMQKDVAGAVGIATNTLCQFEKGRARPSYEVLCALAAFFEVSLDFLVLGKTV